MTTETSKRITAPSDTQFVTMDGRIIQPWHRYLISLRSQAVDSSDEVSTTKTNVADLTTKVYVLEGHFKKSLIGKLGLDSLTVETTPTYDNIRAIADAVVAASAKIDEIIDVLYASTILGD